MSIASPAVYHPAEAAPPTRTLWGMSAMSMHDAYWATMGVRIARPEALPELQRDAGLYLLVGPGEMVLLDFRHVLNLMGWLSPLLCIVRPVVPSLKSGGDVDHESLLRCALTPVADLAEAWCARNGTFAAWRGLKAKVADGRLCVARPVGRIFSEPSEQELLNRLSRIWKDPTQGVPGLKKLGRGLFGLPNSTEVGASGSGRKEPVWLGRGRSLSELSANESTQVLLDAD